MVGPRIRVVSAEGVREIELGSGAITVGRHTENVIPLTDLQASRFHLVIQKTSKGILFKDLDSRNGTLLNGKPARSGSLGIGDVLSVGATELRIVLPAGAGDPASLPARPRPPAAAGGTNAAPTNAAPARPPVARTAPATPPARTPQRPARQAQEPAELPDFLPEPAEPPAAGGAPQYDDLEVLDDDEEVVDLSDPSVLAPARNAARDAAEERVGDILASAPDDGSPGLDFSQSSTRDDDERYLPVLAESLPDKPFDVMDLALVNTRGQVIHPAVQRDAKGKRGKPPNAAESVMVLRYVLLICARSRATDVHLEPKGEDFALRLRIDGNMVDVVRLTKAMGTRLGALVKIMCEIDVQHRNAIQEGHFTALVPGRKIDYRVSFAPSMFGQKLVIRVLDATNSPLHLSDLQLPLPLLKEMENAVNGDSGMILVCGPTGSGKTTTLYSLLRDCGTDRRNVVTIEDPVEIEIPGVTQVPVNAEQGNTFPNLLRSMLRQDPDVMMVGEVRDAETARIAMQAAMTGHLVLSTIHARDTSSTVFRLLDLGIEPYLIAASAQIILSQRLARTLCTYCKRAVRPTEQQLQKMGEQLAARTKQVFVPQGCPSCLRTGYAGRRGFFEMLVVTDDVRDAMQRPHTTPRDIEAAAAKSGRFTRLSQTGYQLVAMGMTAFDEIERVVGR